MIPLLWALRGPGGALTADTIDPRAVVGAPEALPAGLVVPEGLPAVAASALALRAAHPDAPASTDGLLGDDVDAPLRLLVEAHNADRADGVGRLADPAFLADRLAAAPWIPDDGHAEGIRLTRYVVWQVDGARSRGGPFDTALYAVPADDDGPDPVRLRLSRQEVLAGAFEPGGPYAGLAEPVVWLREADVHQAMLQGSVEVRLAEGGTALFNVHRNNGVPYDRSERQQARQRRTWYFREVQALRGVQVGDDAAAVVPWICAAGDVQDLGVGRLVTLALPDGPTLVIVSDTGGAFEPNLHQLDWFVGAWPDDAAYRAATAHLPDRVRASFVVARP